MNKYTVLWFDDKFEEYDVDIDTAFQKGIQLVGYTNAEDGLIELKNNYADYDAVIVDGLFYNDPNQKGDPIATAFGEVANVLRDLKSKGIVIPWFIYSGQPGFIKDEMTLIEVLKDRDFADGKVYDKNNIADFEKLCNDLIFEANNIDSTLIKNKYQRVFDVCTEKYIGENAKRDLLNLLLNIDNSSTENQFNTLRKIVEDVFIAFNKFQLLPNEFITPSVAINESSKFLSGKNHKGELFTEKGYQHQEQTHLPEQISAMLWNILNITQNGSHRSTIDQHVKMLNTSYLIQSVLYQLLDVVVWFKIHIDSNPKLENWTKIENKAQTTISNIKKGEVINLNTYKGFAFLKPEDGTDNVFIPPHIVTNSHLKETDVIRCEIEEYADNRTNELKKRVKKLIE
ncbi:hypothetical protein [Psychroserpens jangbogonensis]|uniref:hypothetical protein n=1 Tax=Psychroserpens jangbogonensis TaxID=1484460 RepID=UPI00053F01A1|nr:hypothetical protein [Psychroserpens jangbogonensis]